MIEDDTHDKLTKAYLEYYKANEKFEAANSYEHTKNSRRWLREIRILLKYAWMKYTNTQYNKATKKDQEQS